MNHEFYVHLLPTLRDPEIFRGGVAVVIDVLRASTTIIQAITAGASSVIPCLEVDDAFRIRDSLPTGSAILGGERHGKMIEGFDLDNSPLRYTPEAVKGKTVVFTTSNGTRAMDYAKQAERIYIGAFVNRDALRQQLRNETRPIHLVCAGTDGEITLEDVLFAGELGLALTQDRGKTLLADDQTNLALRCALEQGTDPHKLCQSLRESNGGRNLVALGFDADIERAAERNRFKIVPELCSKTRQITDLLQGEAPLTHLMPQSPAL